MKLVSEIGGCLFDFSFFFEYKLFSGSFDFKWSRKAGCHQRTVSRCDVSLLAKGS